MNATTRPNTPRHLLGAAALAALLPLVTQASAQQRDSYEDVQIELRQGDTTEIRYLDDVDPTTSRAVRAVLSRLEAYSPDPGQTYIDTFVGDGGDRGDVLPRYCGGTSDENHTLFGCNDGAKYCYVHIDWGNLGNSSAGCGRYEE